MHRRGADAPLLAPTERLAWRTTHATSMEYTAVWIWLRLTLATCILELVYSQLLALRKNVHQSWPLALNFDFYEVSVKFARDKNDVIREMDASFSRLGQA